jgi:hypothetical protein
MKVLSINIADSMEVTLYVLMILEFHIALCNTVRYLVLRMI